MFEKFNLNLKRRSNEPVNLYWFRTYVRHVNDLVFGVVGHQITEVQVQAAVTVLVPIYLIIVRLKATQKSVICDLYCDWKKQISIHMDKRVVST